MDIPTVSRWLAHKDGGALAMKTYGHLRREHSIAQAQRVSFAPAVMEQAHVIALLPRHSCPMPNRFFPGALVLGEPVPDVIRRELRRVSPDVRIETDQIKAVLTNEVLKLGSYRQREG